jgi:hypothetical protein
VDSVREADLLEKVTILPNLLELLGERSGLLFAQGHRFILNKFMAFIVFIFYFEIVNEEML